MGNEISPVYRYGPAEHLDQRQSTRERAGERVTDGPPLVDARRVADDVSGSEGTFHEFSPDLWDRIDYVFVPESVPVREYRAVPDQVGAYRSDHLPLLTVLDPWT